MHGRDLSTAPLKMTGQKKHSNKAMLTRAGLGGSPVVIGEERLHASEALLIGGERRDRVGHASNRAPPGQALHCDWWTLLQCP